MFSSFSILQSVFGTIYLKTREREWGTGQEQEFKVLTRATLGPLYYIKYNLQL
jgi:hypothetical protein